MSKKITNEVEAMETVASRLDSVAMCSVEKRKADTAPAFFAKLDASIARSIKASRVINVSQLKDMKEKVFCIMQKIDGMKDTQALTLEQIQKQVYAALESPVHKASKDSKTIEYGLLSDVVRESDILKAFFIYNTLFGELHLILNKNGTLAIQKNAAKISLLSSSFYVPVETTDESGEKITYRITVKFNETFKNAVKSALAVGLDEYRKIRIGKKPDTPEIEATEATEATA